MFFVKKKCDNQIFYLGWPNGGKKLVKILWQVATWQVAICNLQSRNCNWQVATWQVATSQDATKNHENIENGLKRAQIGAPELGIMPTGSKK